MITKTISYADLVVGKKVSCRYPKGGDGDKLVQRSGEVYFLGHSKNGNFFTIDMGNGQMRNLSERRVIDLTEVVG